LAGKQNKRVEQTGVTSVNGRWRRGGKEKRKKGKPLVHPVRPERGPPLESNKVQGPSGSSVEKVRYAYREREKKLRECAKPFSVTAGFRTRGRRTNRVVLFGISADMGVGQRPRCGVSWSTYVRLALIGEVSELGVAMVVRVADT